LAQTGRRDREIVAALHLEIVASEYTADQAEFEAVEGRRRVLEPLK
jgi:hypothetical protein